MSNLLPKHRKKCYSLLFRTFFAWFWALVVSMGYYPFQKAVGIEFSFLPFIVVLALSIMGMWTLLPETKNKTTNEIVKEFRKRKASVSISHLATLTGKHEGRHPELAALLEETGEDDDDRHRGYQSTRSG